ncbi:MAG TPA: hypothetical protein VM491_05780 [Burkholderiaceae bacterium]|nr:hypothetical protein [Burkholderiaceae bacterium]
MRDHDLDAVTLGLPRLPLDHCDGALAVRGQLDPLQDSDRVDDRRKRVAQLVREHRQKLVLQPIRLCELLGQLAVLGFALAQCGICARAVGHVGADHEDAGDLAVAAPNRLVDEVHDALDCGAAFGRLNDDSGAVRSVRLAGGEHLVEQCQVALGLGLRQRFRHRRSDHVAPVDQLAIRRVDDLEPVIRAPLSSAMNDGACSNS